MGKCHNDILHNLFQWKIVESKFQKYNYVDVKQYWPTKSNQHFLFSGLLALYWAGVLVAPMKQ